MVVTKEICLMEGNGHAKEVSKREKDHVREVLTLMEGEVMLQRWKEGEWSCYGGCHFIGGRKVIRGSEVVSVMEGG